MPESCSLVHDWLVWAQWRPFPRVSTVTCTVRFHEKSPNDYSVNSAHLPQPFGLLQSSARYLSLKYLPPSYAQLPADPLFGCSLQHPGAPRSVCLLKIRIVRYARLPRAGVQGSPQQSPALVRRLSSASAGPSPGTLHSPGAVATPLYLPSTTRAVPIDLQPAPALPCNGAPPSKIPLPPSLLRCNGPSKGLSLSRSLSVRRISFSSLLLPNTTDGVNHATTIPPRPRQPRRNSSLVPEATWYISVGPVQSLVHTRILVLDCLAWLRSF